jgi:hypothetical protein
LGGPGSSQVSLGCVCTGSGGPGYGGALFSSGDLAMTNSTLAANAAMGGASGIGGIGSRGSGGNALGGGLHSTGNSELNFVTFGRNESIGGDGLFVVVGVGGNLAVPSGHLSLRNSILDHTSSSGAQCDGTFVDNGHNISSDDACALTGPGSLNGVDPRLGPLAANGGLTLTMALLEGSPAIDGADETDCIAIDQRGLPRPAAVRCDIGAYEEQPHLFVIQSLERTGDQVLLRGRGALSASFRVQASTELISWQEAGAGTVGVDGTFEIFSPLLPGPQTFYRIISP